MKQSEIERLASEYEEMYNAETDGVSYDYDDSYGEDTEEEINFDR